ncbi:MAG: 50S ribosomal protein L28 [Candidatus Ratteibacteria bacterium]
MGKKCAVCGKCRKPGMLLSHSHHRTKRFFGANLQKVRTTIGRILVCTGCLKSGKVIKPIAPLEKSA